MSGTRLRRMARHMAAAPTAAASEAEVEEARVMAALLEQVTSLDPATYAANRLSDEERAFYAREGYLVIRNAIVDTRAANSRASWGPPGPLGLAIV